MTKPSPLPPQEVIQKLIRYDSNTGKCYWKPRTKDFFSEERDYKNFVKQHEGKEIGTPDTSGYLRVNFPKYKNYAVHRLIYKLIYNDEPRQIDHQDHNRQNNKIDNLVSSDPLKNNKNHSSHINSSFKQMGIEQCAKTGAFRARIGVNKKIIQLGTYNTYEEAVERRKAAEIRYGFHKNHGKDC